MTKSDKYNIDGHKLIYHPNRVCDWLDNKLIYPIYLDISPSGICNNRCIFCCCDFRGYKNIFLDKDIFKNRIAETAKLGIKSALFAGEGEPLLHKNIGEMITFTKQSGIDVALSTNGILLNKEIVNQILSSLSWIKISCAAGSKETHTKIHKSNINDFDKIFKNLEYAVKFKVDNNLDTTIGLQFLLLPDNVHEIEMITAKCQNAGLDYITIKPFTQSKFAKNKIYKDIKYEDYLYLGEELKKYNTDKFNVVFRLETMQLWDAQYRGYNKCLSLPFASSIDCMGNVWACCACLGDKHLYYGNIYQNTFEEIWKSELHKKALEWVDTKMDINQCQVNCRMGKVNKYLWDLKYLVKHVNFI